MHKKKSLIASYKQVLVRVLQDVSERNKHTPALTCEESKKLLKWSNWFRLNNCIKVKDSGGIYLKIKCLKKKKKICKNICPRV